jgi:hypothetical protein
MSCLHRCFSPCCPHLPLACSLPPSASCFLRAFSPAFSPAFSSHLLLALLLRYLSCLLSLLPSPFLPPSVSLSTITCYFRSPSELTDLFLTLLPTSHPAPHHLDQVWRLPPTPPSSRWEGGVGGSLARDLALIGGGRGGQLFPAKPGTSVIESHPPPRPRGGSQTRPPADDLRDEAPNHPANHLVHHLANHFGRLRRRFYSTHRLHISQDSCAYTETFIRCRFGVYSRSAAVETADTHG